MLPAKLTRLLGPAPAAAPRRPSPETILAVSSATVTLFLRLPFFVPASPPALTTEGVWTMLESTDGEREYVAPTEVPSSGGKEVWRR